MGVFDSVLAGNDSKLPENGGKFSQNNSIFPV